MNNMNRNPQKDIPTEVIIHYIVRDYRRMFNEHDEMMQLLEKLKKGYESAVREKEELTSKVQSLKAENNNLKTKLGYLKNKASDVDVKKAKKAINMLRRIRDMVSSPVIDEFDEHEDTNDDTGGFSE